MVSMLWVTTDILYRRQRIASRGHTVVAAQEPDANPECIRPGEKSPGR